MSAAITISVGITCLAVAALLLAELKQLALAKTVAKPFASGGFVALAALGGAGAAAYGRAILIALALSFVGDVFLIARGRPRLFKIGVLVFLTAHLAFIGAFAVRGAAMIPTLLILAVMAPISFIIAKKILESVPPALRSAVTAYITVISVMVPFAAGTVVAHGQPLIVVAAVAFYISDISVALYRFVAPTFANRAWGLPLYYGAQLAFAWSALRS